MAPTNPTPNELGACFEVLNAPNLLDLGEVPDYRASSALHSHIPAIQQQRLASSPYTRLLNRLARSEAHTIKTETR
ncbi:hypothetical protein ACKLNR_000253 [Fusarium oxysporum f. sp. zingiberi]|uniref:Uncharacterized protein n=2 Tax=Fusarium oxysporum TaxID=5507 RepID=A0A420NBF9_FUSOX|nr:hypothetical protein Forpi1262_v003272 [Fusarium oxysporum f. sp. raphani]KAK2481789.1 hypothetical protein H9L39_07428 [Fusarium oxysporum f. sp. albedinis]RKK77610.1 hypothetical protein BFJ69_g6158 [Fusarium oxysporum]